MQLELSDETLSHANNLIRSGFDRVVDLANTISEHDFRSVTKSVVLRAIQYLTRSGSQFSIGCLQTYLIQADGKQFKGDDDADSDYEYNSDDTSECEEEEDGTLECRFTKHEGSEFQIRNIPYTGSEVQERYARGFLEEDLDSFDSEPEDSNELKVFTAQQKAIRSYISSLPQPVVDIEAVTELTRNWREIDFSARAKDGCWDILPESTCIHAFPSFSSDAKRALCMYINMFALTKVLNPRWARSSSVLYQNAVARVKTIQQKKDEYKRIFRRKKERSAYLLSQEVQENREMKEKYDALLTVHEGYVLERVEKKKAYNSVISDSIKENRALKRQIQHLKRKIKSLSRDNHILAENREAHTTISHEDAVFERSALHCETQGSPSYTPNDSLNDSLVSRASATSPDVASPMFAVSPVAPEITFDAVDCNSTGKMSKKRPNDADAAASRDVKRVRFFEHGVH